jgi:hypothetical protein
MSGWSLLIVGVSLAYAATELLAPRAVAVAFAWVAVLPAAGITWAAAILLALRCDENCNDNLVPSAREPGWTHWIHSWQWYLQFALAAGALVAAIAAAAAFVLRRRTAARTLAVLAAASAIAWAVAMPL